MHITDSVSQQNGLGTSHLHWNKDAVSKTVFNITVSTTVLELHDFVSYAAFEFCFVTSSLVYMCQNFPTKKKFLQMIWEPLIYIGIGLLIPELFSLLLYLYRFNF